MENKEIHVGEGIVSKGFVIDISVADNELLAKEKAANKIIETGKFNHLPDEFDWRITDVEENDDGYIVHGSVYQYFFIKFESSSDQKDYLQEEAENKIIEEERFNDLSNDFHWEITHVE